MKFFANSTPFSARYCDIAKAGAAENIGHPKILFEFWEKGAAPEPSDGLTIFVKSSHCAGRCDAGEGLSIQSNILLKTDFFDSLKGRGSPSFLKSFFAALLA